MAVGAPSAFSAPSALATPSALPVASPKRTSRSTASIAFSLPSLSSASSAASPSFGQKWGGGVSEGWGAAGVCVCAPWWRIGLSSHGGGRIGLLSSNGTGVGGGLLLS